MGSHGMTDLVSRISYAQNAEDVLLWRALGHISRGFYVDIGAYDPDADSVSRMFYDAGWRGIHVEPVPEYCDRLRAARADETVIEAVVGNRPGLADLYVIRGTGLSTLFREIAERHASRGYDYSRIQVPVITLEALLASTQRSDIHWLKIDVEGAESEVIESWGQSAIVPWILVVESTRPSEREECYESWEPKILKRGYKFAFFDGLNRYYVSPEHLDLLSAFTLPANIFDDYVLAPSHPLTKHVVAQWQEERERLMSLLEACEAALERLGAENTAVDQGGAVTSSDELKASKAEVEMLRGQLRLADDALAEARQRLSETWQHFAEREHQSVLLVSEVRKALQERERQHGEQTQLFQKAAQELANAHDQLLTAQSQYASATEQRERKMARLFERSSETENTLRRQLAQAASDADEWRQRFAAASCSREALLQLVADIERLRSTRWKKSLHYRMLAQKAQQLKKMVEAQPLPFGEHHHFAESQCDDVAWILNCSERGAGGTVVEELMSLNDKEFVIAAYRIMLRRAPDSQGGQAYLGRVRSGENKLRLLCEIRSSREGRAVGAMVEGMQWPLRCFAFRRIPLLNVLFGFAGGIRSGGSGLRALRRLENILVRQGAEEVVELRALKAVVEAKFNVAGAEAAYTQGTGQSHAQAPGGDVLADALEGAVGRWGG